MPGAGAARLLAADAFAALSHLSLIVLGIYGFTFIGSAGAVYQILNHGVVDGALFLLLGVLYDRYSTSQIDAYGGLAAQAAAHGHALRHHLAGHDRTADAERLCGRVPDPLQHL